VQFGGAEVDQRLSPRRSVELKQLAVDVQSHIVWTLENSTVK
jgi:hypothetical protein